MISPYVLRAIGWRSMDLECDGAVLVGGLEHELRHFGDPDEEHDVWIDPASARPYDYTHEGARAFATAEQEEKQRKLRVARRSSLLGISNYENDATQDESFYDIVEDIKGEARKRETMEGDDELLEFHDVWLGGGFSEDGEHKIICEDCAHCSRLAKENVGDDSKEANRCAEHIVEEAMEASITDTEFHKEREDTASDIDLTDSFILMFNEEIQIQTDEDKAGNINHSIELSTSHQSCHSDDFSFVEIEDTGAFSGSNETGKTRYPARSAMAARSGIWQSITAYKPLERARQSHIVRTGSWQAV